MAKLLQIQVGEHLSTPDGLPSNRVLEPPAPLATDPRYSQGTSSTRETSYLTGPYEPPLLLLLATDHGDSFSVPSTL